MSESGIAKAPHPATEDARDLLALLYREIGISAVAAALETHDLADTREDIERDIPAILRGEDLAA